MYQRLTLSKETTDFLRSVALIYCTVRKHCGDRSLVVRVNNDYGYQLLAFSCLLFIVLFQKVSEQFVSWSITKFGWCDKRLTQTS